MNNFNNVVHAFKTRVIPLGLIFRAPVFNIYRFLPAIIRFTAIYIL